MSNSAITEKALAEALKMLMKTYPINKIYVRMITDECKLTRQTFYNHFQDIYHLLGWIYEREIIELLEDCCNLARWREGIHLVLQYTVDNRTICLNTFRSIGRDHLEAFIFQVFNRVLMGIIADIAQRIHVEDDMKREMADFHANAITGIFIAWLKQDLKQDPAFIAGWIERMFEGNIIRLMKQYANP